VYKTHCDQVNPGDNVIIGLGDSFTQGIGAYSLDTWKSIPHDPARFNISGQHFLDEQAANNWVRQLQKSFLPDYKVINLGVNGAGNRATIREMYLNPLPDNLGNVIVILMATAIERYDFLKQSDETAGIDWHYKWQTIFPTISDRGAISRLEKEYVEQIHSMRNDALQFLFNICEAKNFCRARGYKFLFGSAFDMQINRNNLMRDLKEKGKYIDIVDWNDFITIKDRYSFMDMVDQLEGNRSNTIHDIFKRNANAKMPSKYITPCSHWTIEGQFKVAEYLYNELSSRNLL